MTPLLFNSPLFSDKADRLIELLQPPTGGRVIDVGCGTGEFLLRVVRRYPVHGVGVDINAESLAAARQSATERFPDASVEFVESDIHEYAAADASFDAAICLGATHAYSMGEPAYPETLKGLSRLVKPGGRVLIGEGHWTQPPDKEYLEFIGDPVGSYRTHQENVELGEAFGMTPLYAAVSSLDEWDDFEWRHHVRAEEVALANPDDEQAAQRLAHGRAWRKAYLRWGRGVMGFGFYLFAAPRS